MRRAALRMRGSSAGTDSRRLSRSVALSAKDLITGTLYNVRANRLAWQQFPWGSCPAAPPGPPLRSARSTTSRAGTLTTRICDGHPRGSTGAPPVEPGSSHQSGDRAAHMRLGAPEPPAQDPLRDPTPGPDRTPDPRTVSKSATKAVAVPMRRRQNRGITRFRLSHPDRAAAFVADLDNHRPHLGHPQPGRTRDPAAHDPQRARARPTPRTASTCSA